MSCTRVLDNHVDDTSRSVIRQLCLHGSTYGIIKFAMLVRHYYVNALLVGESVPIATAPDDVMRSLSIKLLAEDVKNAKCPSSLFVVSAPAIPLI